MIRDVFPREDTDFTPWMARNLHILGRYLGMKLILVDIETSTQFARRIDILAEESNLDSSVVIENQYEKSDDNHLGRLLVYACDARAGVVVWVAERFSHEHLQTVKWINEGFGDGLLVFAVEVSTRVEFRGKMTPVFSVVAHPEMWEKSRKQLVSGEPTYWRDLYEDFWTELVTDLQAAGIGMRLTLPKRDRFYSVWSGFSKINYVARFTPQESRVSIELLMPNLKRHWHQPTFQALKEYEQEIADQLDEKPSWELQPHRNYSRVRISTTGNIQSSKGELASIRRWMRIRLQQFHEVLDPYVDEVLSWP